MASHSCAGAVAEAKPLFEEAERMQAEWQPEYPILYSAQGFQHCDLLLGEGQAEEVRRRAARTLPWEEEETWLLAIGLDHLSLRRAGPAGTAESSDHLDQAVDFLRRAGSLHRLPWGLLARGTDADLAEVLRIATRSGMRLCLADSHLAMARKHGSREHMEQAAALVEETGYHRRDREVEELRRKLAAVATAN
jgi:hypothetical protein